MLKSTLFLAICTSLLFGATLILAFYAEALKSRSRNLSNPANRDRSGILWYAFGGLD
jgi:hypothetical protein